MKKWILFAGFFAVSAVMLYLRAPWAVVGLWTVALLTDGAIAYASLRLQASVGSDSAALKSLQDEVQSIESQIAGLQQGMGGLRGIG